MSNHTKLVKELRHAANECQLMSNNYLVISSSSVCFIMDWNPSYSLPPGVGLGLGSHQLPVVVPLACYENWYHNSSPLFLVWFFFKNLMHCWKTPTVCVISVIWQIAVPSITAWTIKEAYETQCTTERKSLTQPWRNQAAETKTWLFKKKGWRGGAAR